ncbi:hypothetical protein IAT38_008147 [Cryptococcus sp. DSM 104549]
MSNLRGIIHRSVEVLRRGTQQAIKMSPVRDNSPVLVYSFDSARPPVVPLHELSTGTDAQVGGSTTADLAIIRLNPGITSPASADAPAGEASSSSSSYLAFFGNMSTALPAKSTELVRTGFAGFRNTSRTTIFGQDLWNMEALSHLKVEVAYRGWEGWRNRFVVNIGTDDRPKTDVFQTRLELPPTPLSTSSTHPLNPLAPPHPQFTTLYIPLSSFVLIQRGHVAHSTIHLNRSAVRTVGFALLGRDRDDIPTRAPADQERAAAAAARALGAGGWGTKTDARSEAERDPELRRMLEEDRLLSMEDDVQAAKPNKPKARGNYHRAGATPAPVEELAEDEEEVEVQGIKEGYYELSIKSVEAVNWDPESDGWA